MKRIKSIFQKKLDFKVYVDEEMGSNNIVEINDSVSAVESYQVSSNQGTYFNFWSFSLTSFFRDWERKEHQEMETELMQESLYIWQQQK